MNVERGRVEKRKGISGNGRKVRKVEDGRIWLKLYFVLYRKVIVKYIIMYN